MPFPLKAKGRKARGGSAQSDSQSWVYALLCLGVAGFLGWVWWHSNQESQPAAKKSNLLEKKVVQNTPVHLEPGQYKAVTNALDEFAQVAEKIKKPSGQEVHGRDGLEERERQSSIQSALTASDTNAHQVDITTIPVPHRVPDQYIPSPPVSMPPVVTLPQDRSRFGLRPVETVLEAQITLARLGIFPGSIDGRMGTQTSLALKAYQRRHGLPVTGLLDKNTKPTLLLSAPTTTAYAITTNDLGRLLPLSKTWLGKSEQPRLDFENILELLGEKSFSSPRLVKDLNPGVDWDHVAAGMRVILPSVEFPPVENKAAVVRISLQNRMLEAFDSETNLLVHFPCSIGHLAEKRPVGELRVETVIPNPNYTFDPAVFPESEDAQSIGRKLVLPPGPNNPVGTAWIGLNRPGYGIHGTPVPEQVGRTESHGCFRLANWDAGYLARLVWIGMPVVVEP